MAPIEDVSTQTTGGRADPSERRFDGPWLAVLAVATGVWTVLYAIDWLLLPAGTQAAAAVGFAHGYLVAPLVTAAVLLDALSLGERGVLDFGVFTWIYALVALLAPPVVAAYYAHREWLTPDDAALLADPEDDA